MSVHLTETDEDVMKPRPGEMSLTEASSQLGIPTETIKAAIKRGDIPARREEKNNRRASFVKRNDVLHFKNTIWVPHYPRRDTRPHTAREAANAVETSITATDPMLVPPVTEPTAALTLEPPIIPSTNPLPAYLPNNVGVVQLGEVTFLNLLYISVPITEVRRIAWDVETGGVGSNACRVFTVDNAEGYLLVGKWADELRKVYQVQRVKAVNT